MFDLQSHLDSGMIELVQDALRVSVRKPRQLAYLSRFMRRVRQSRAVRERQAALGVPVPPFLIASITSNCNLFCTGCYARANGSCGSAAKTPMSAERWGRLFAEAEELGVCFILLAGGEPMLRQDVLFAAAAHQDILFPVFTNGTLMGEEALALFDRHRNLLPVISLEGGRASTDERRGTGVYDRVIGGMEALAAHSVLFGASITVTRGNLDEVTGDELLSDLKLRGCSLVFYVEYVPSDEVSRDQAPTEEGRRLLAERIAALKAAHGIMIVSFPGDEKFTGGCLAAGRGFVHVAVDGSLEPCPFSPYSDTSLKEQPLADALRSPFLTRIREGGMLLGEHDGGCLLFERQAEVEALLAECRGR